jgi:hypothetical protein
MERPTDDALKLKVQSFIDLILYFNDSDFHDFIHLHDKIIYRYQPNQIEIDGVKYFRATC